MLTSKYTFLRGYKGCGGKISNVQIYTLIRALIRSTLNISKIFVSCFCCLFVLSLNLFSFSLQNGLSNISELFQEQEFTTYAIQKQFVKKEKSNY